MVLVFENCPHSCKLTLRQTGSNTVGTTAARQDAKVDENGRRTRVVFSTAGRFVSGRRQGMAPRCLHLPAFNLCRFDHQNRAFFGGAAYDFGKTPKGCHNIRCLDYLISDRRHQSRKEPKSGRACPLEFCRRNGTGNCSGSNSVFVSKNRIKRLHHRKRGVSGERHCNAQKIPQRRRQPISSPKNLRRILSSATAICWNSRKPTWGFNHV